MTFVIAALYKFFDLKDPKALADRISELFQETGILGTIILAGEGINGTVCGSRQAIDELKVLLSELKIEDGGQYKEATHHEQVFKRAKVKIKDEIVTFGCPTKPTENAGQYVAPKDWNKLISNPEVILIDTRNDYEYKIGTFKGAVNPQTENFRQFADFVEQKLKGREAQPIAMFCTGGIRCEKSTANLIEQGFKKVYHLEGGILKYLEEIDPKDSLWHGECFVFDGRVAVEHGLKVGTASVCYGCGTSLLRKEVGGPGYEFGVSCGNCVETKSEQAKQRLRSKFGQQKQG